MREIEAQAKALAPVFGRLLEKAKAALRDEFKSQIAERDEAIASLRRSLSELPGIEAIAKQAAALIPAPKDGDPGRDADMGELKAHLQELVAAIPAPQDGKSVSAEEVAPLIKEEVAKAVAATPAPQDGKSVTVDDVRPMVDEMVASAVKALPPAQPGKDADIGLLKDHLGDLVKSIQLPAVPSAEEVAAYFERRFADLSLSWERQARDTFDKAADRMPIPQNGKDGRDAVPLDGFALELGEDGRTVTVKMQAGTAVVERSIKLPTVIDRGVYSSGSTYEKGDGTTYGGCYWIAQKDEPEGVPGGSDDWRLAVKKGRDGKDLRESASRHDPSKGVSIRAEQ